MNTQRDLQQQKETVETVKRQGETTVKTSNNKLKVRTGISAGRRMSANKGRVDSFNSSGDEGGSDSWSWNG